MLKWLGGLRDSNEREINKLRPIVETINELEPEFKKLGTTKQNPLADSMRQQITTSIEYAKTQVEKIHEQLETSNRLIRSVTLKKELEKNILPYLKEVNDSLKKELLDKQINLITSIEDNGITKTDSLEKRITNAITNIKDLLKHNVEAVNAALNAINKAITRLEIYNRESYTDLLQKQNKDVLSGKSAYINEIDKAEEDLVKLQSWLDIKESIWFLDNEKTTDNTKVIFSNIIYQLNNFTLEDLEAKTYEYKNRITAATIETQKEINAAETTLFKAPLIIEIFHASDDVVKALLGLKEVELKDELSAPQQLDVQAYQERQGIRQKAVEFEKILLTIQALLKGDNKERVIGFTKLEGISDEILQRFGDPIEQINEYERALSDYKQLPDGVLPGVISNLKKIRRDQEKDILFELLPEAFAAVREAARRKLGQRHFDVQLLGGMVLHQGKVAEMKTGEGKTLVATLPLYLNALTGRGVHLVTVNDYLARRDPYWMGPIFYALGLSVASIFPPQIRGEATPAVQYDPKYEYGEDDWPHFIPIKRPAAYKADITYGTSAEFGFDFLRDNLAHDLKQYVQREPNYAIVDEADSLLIDEARTPLIISAPDVESSQKYQVFARLVQSLKPGVDYEAKEKERSVEPTDEGYTHIEGLLKREGLLEGESLYDPHNIDLMRHLRNALSAKEFYRRDREYVVKDGEIIIVDEFTGRLMLGRRYSEGLHQAIEAKEHEKVQQETKTFATVTIQNYFRMYPKLAGMTGTAATEAEELSKIYKLDVVQIPTNIEYRAENGELEKTVKQDKGVEIITYHNKQQPAEQYWKRIDYPDLIYKSEDCKFAAISKEIQRINQTGQPILAGTTSIEKNERLSSLLNRCGVKHNVLNAKNHRLEARSIAKAGELGAVTVATNMAGRGVDIVLGGNPSGYDPSDFIIYKVLGKEDIDNARELLHEDTKNNEYPPLIENDVKALQQTESELRQKRQDSVIGAGDIDDRVIIQLQTQQRERYHKLTVDFMDWEKNIVERLQRSLLEADKKGLNDTVKKISSMLEKFAKHDNYDVQIEDELKRHELAWTNWDKNHDKVRKLGGLYVIGTERHEARRIDNQLRGRSGRQGDPGGSRFFVALDDDIMRRFGGERVQGIMNWAGMDENTPIENRLISRSIENAQTRVEGYHFDMRKHLVDYDDVINKQREVIYGERRKILSGADLRSNILSMIRQEIEEAVTEHTTVTAGNEPDHAALMKHLTGLFPPNVTIKDLSPESLSRQTPKDIIESFNRIAESFYAQKEKEYGAEGMRVLERLVMLQVIDTLWVEHLTAIDYLRQGIGMHAVGQQDPLVAYRRQSSEMFQELLDTIREDVAHTIFKVSLVKKEAPGVQSKQAAAPATHVQAARSVSAPIVSPAFSSPMEKVVGQTGQKQSLPQPGQKVGRNEPCPCGSGKKYKHCCGK